MRSQKRYTNATFTKRVDHEAGRHRTRRAPSEPRVCTGCGAVYSKRRWWPKTSERAAVLHAIATPTVCDACRQRSEGIARGILTLDGAFLKTHRQDVEHLLRAEADRAAEDNPLARIIGWDDSVPDTITISTSTEHLVLRLGHALQRAYAGQVDYVFGHEDKTAHATWRRD